MSTAPAACIKTLSSRPIWSAGPSADWPMSLRPRDCCADASAICLATFLTAHRRWHELVRPLLDAILIVRRNRATHLLTARFGNLKDDRSKDAASRLRAIIALSHNFLGLRDLRRIIEHSGALRELIVENGVMGDIAYRPALHHAHFSVADERAFAIAPDMRSLRIERWGGSLCHSACVPWRGQVDEIRPPGRSHPHRASGGGADPVAVDLVSLVRRRGRDGAVDRYPRIAAFARGASSGRLHS